MNSFIKNKPLIITPVFILFCLIGNVFSQTKFFEKNYGGIRDDYGFAVKELSDGNYMISGWTKSYNTGNPNKPDVYLLKTKPNGDSIWFKNFGTTESEYGFSMDLTKDGGYIIGGHLYDFFSEYLIMKIKPNGTLDWTKSYKGKFPLWDNYLTSVKQTTDNGYILAGYSNAFDTTNFDIWLIKTDSTGDTLWTKTFGGIYNEEAWSIIQTTDGGYAILGTTFSYGKNSGNYSDIYLIKTNNHGDSLWTKHYGGDYNEFGNDIMQTQDNGFVVAGSNNSMGKGMSDLWLIRTDSMGDTIWTKTYGGTSEDQGRFVKSYKGGYLIGGISYSESYGNSDGYVVITTSNGSFVKSFHYGGAINDEFQSGLVTKNDDILLIGNTSSKKVTNADILFVKLGQGTSIPNLPDSKNKVLVYPNPFEHEMNVYFNDNEIHKVRFILSDINGKEIVNIEKTTANFLNVPLSNTQSGIYFYRIILGDGEQYWGKLIGR